MQKVALLPHRKHLKMTKTSVGPPVASSLVVEWGHRTAGQVKKEYRMEAYPR